MTPTDTDTVDLADVLAALDRLDADAFGRFLAPDARYTQGNFDTVVGRDAIVSATASFLASVGAIRHDLTQVWPVAGGVVAHGITTVTRVDGASFAMPTALVTRISGGLITDHRVFIDVSPLAG